MIGSAQTSTPAAIGYMIHTFGDSYAHTYLTKNGDRKAYGWWIGHGLAAQKAADFTGPKGYGKDFGHAPDIIPYHFENYRDYVSNLTVAIARLHGQTGVTPQQQAQLDTFLLDVQRKIDSAPGWGKGDNGSTSDAFFFNVAKQHGFPDLPGTDGNPFIPHENARQTLRNFPTPTREQVEGFMEHIYSSIYGVGNSVADFIRKTNANR